MLADEEIEIVSAAPQDVPSIQTIARATWAATYTGIIPDDVQRKLLESWYAGENLEQELRSGDSTFLLARAAQQTVGFANVVRVSTSVAMLARLYVLPEHQNQRIGSKLLGAAVAKLKSEGIGKFLVNVERDNVTARRFYGLKGFAELSESTIDLPGHQLPVVLCERRL
jgi:ribosomal protein S18 acetylase RimI-like enzyme